MKLPGNPRVFLTGGASGLGRALCLALAPRGARILIGDVDLAGAEDTAARVRERGGTAEVVRCDVAKLADVEAACERLETLWGGTDLLVNNAGVAVAGAMGVTPIADWDWIVRINLWGPIHGCHVFVPRMKERKSGAILNVASAAAFAALPNMSAYNTTKAAVLALSETLHGELLPHGIHVSVLCPTFFRTRLLDAMRVSDQNSRDLAEAFFRRSRATSEGVAQDALDGLEAGQFMIIPQADGRFTWRVKRLAPALYLKTLGSRLAAKAQEKLRKSGT